MRKCIVFAVVLIATAGAAVAAPQGMTTRKSPFDVFETLDRLERILEGKGFTIVARINHAEGAVALGETLRATQLLLFSDRQSEITLLRIIQPPHLFGEYGELVTTIRRMAHDDAEAYLHTQKENLSAQGYKVNARLAEADLVAEVVLDVANELGIDIIVMSTHGRSGITRWVYGSIADRVLRHATVPVLLIRSTL